MRGDDEGFGPCDCGEIECWAGNAEITRDDYGNTIRHSRYACRPVKPKPAAPASDGTGKEERDLCSSCSVRANERCPIEPRTEPTTACVHYYTAKEKP